MNEATTTLTRAGTRSNSVTGSDRKQWRFEAESLAHLDRSTHLRKVRYCEVVPLTPQVPASTQPVG